MGVTYLPFALAQTLAMPSVLRQYCPKRSRNTKTNSKDVSHSRTRYSGTRIYADLLGNDYGTRLENKETNSL
jgi:hypothetical protein